MKKYLFIIFFSVFSFADELSDYLNLLKKSEEMPFVILEKENFSWLNYPKEIEIKFIEGLKAKKQLSEIGIGRELPMLFNLLENGIGKDIIYVKYCEGIGYKTNCMMAGIYKRIYSQSGLQLGMETYGNVAFSWLKHNDGERVFDCNEIIYFWWNYDRKHVPEIWNKWYKCWQIENDREKPRDVVLDRLAYDITRLGFYFFPYIYSAIKSGDNSLNGLFSPNKSVNNNFITWWEKNKENYILPDPKGWNHINTMISDKKLPFGSWQLENMPKWHQMAEEYYSKTDNNDHYWYYLIPDKDEITFEDIWEANSVSIKIQK
ncbi:hypothetical protein J6X96_01320 [bacterium]|nr:hypothetical protein [bacterium]